jgi:hypothetical protein
VTRLERRGRLLLRAYPAGYRQQRGEEILGTLLEASPPGRSWPRPRDSWALVLGGLRARAMHNQRLPIVASLRLATLLGVCVYLSFSAFGYLLDGWQPALVGLLLCVAALAPWLGRRPAMTAAVLAAGVVLALAVATGPLTTIALLPVGITCLALAAAAILSAGAERPPRAWLWLPGLAVAAWLVAELSWATGWFPVWAFTASRPAVLLAGLAVAVLAWIVTDPRPAIGLATCLALVGLFEILVGSGAEDLMLLNVARLAAIWLGSAIVLAVPACWRLRRRAVL